MVQELLNADQGIFPMEIIFGTGEWLEANRDQLSMQDIRYTELSRKELVGISTMVSPQEVLALVKIPDPMPWSQEGAGGPVLALEAIRDPGNLGTILRTADWFGIEHILCSEDSVDLYNPKVVQSSMGSITRVNVHYLDLGETLVRMARDGSTVYGTYMEGENLYSTSWKKNPLILFGNEANGISSKLSDLVDRRITIPAFPLGDQRPESLNLASSVAIICSEIRKENG